MKFRKALIRKLWITYPLVHTALLLTCFCQAGEPAKVRLDLVGSLGGGTLFSPQTNPTSRVAIGFDFWSSEFPKYRIGISTVYRYFGERLSLDNTYVARTFSFLSFKYRTDEFSEDLDSMAIQLRVGYGSRMLLSSTRFKIVPAFGISTEYRRKVLGGFFGGIELAYEYMPQFETQLRHHRGLNIQDLFASSNGSAVVPDAHILVLSLIGYFSF